MSNRALSWAFDARLDPGPKFVLVGLADHAADHSGEDWTCFPSIARLMAQTGMSSSTVERHLKWLWREGWISRARRRRADGTLGIYDFTLHREPERRDELRAARQGAVKAGEKGCEENGEPPCKLTGGEGAAPPVNLTPTTRQNGASPPVNLTGQEPLGEPLEEPSTGRAREPGSEGWEEAVAAWPESGRKRTSWTKGRAAWAWACGIESPARLLAAVKACAADPDLARGDHGWPGLHTWLSEERWRVWMPAARPQGCAGKAADGPVFAGPADLRAAIVVMLGEGFAGTLDRCGWDGERVIASTSWAFDKLRPLAGLIEEHGAHLVAPQSGEMGR